MLCRLVTTVAVLAGLSLGLAAAAGAATYYVSPSGSDSNAGTAQSAPWQSVSRVDSAHLQPGDTVLFQGGATFGGLLQPSGSGSSGAPITFGSYGSGSANLRGGIQLASQSWLDLDHLTVDTGAWQSAGSTRGITTSSSGSGVQDVVVRDCAFRNVALGMMLSNHLDAGWTVEGSTIRYTRDSGILIYDPNQPDEVGGGPMTFDGNQILDTGLDSSLGYNKHGVYDIGHDITWVDNTIARFQSGGFSLRARGNVLEHNTISDGPYGIYYSPYDPTPGTTTIAYNTISNVSQGTITLDSSGLVSNPESFRVLDNTLVASGSAPGIRVLGTSGSVTIANNLVETAGGPGLRVDTLPGGGIAESHDLFWNTSGGVTLGWLGSTYTSAASFLSATGRGAGDVLANPELDASLAPGAGSPAIDAGTASVPGAAYVGDCSGALWHYCGSAPDQGAAESTAPPAPLAPPTQLTAQSVTQTGLALGWTPSTDLRVVSYAVSRGGSPLGTTATSTFAVTGLACGTTYSFAVAGTDAGGSASTPATVSATTAACPAPAPSGSPTLSIDVHNGQTIPTTFRVTATASATPAVRNVTFWFDGYTPCVVTSAPYVSCQISASEGGHTLRVRATSTNGLYTETTIHVWCDPNRTTLSARTTAKHRR